MATFKLEVFTPYRLFFSSEVEAITLQLADGEAGIYAGHSFFTAPFKTCILRIREISDGWKEAFITNGIIEVKRYKTVLLADAAEWPWEIDKERALSAKNDAESVLINTSFKFEHRTAKEKLIRAQTRLNVINHASPDVLSSGAG
ncbi:MAG: ATP synthase F1 subunit epsilon [Spirochaetaceae bacterium]|jgi:F-type H+-transporting ATPase subunit epsilon|nr:ATP synthase F1 subunit epsilon [Spirochaetaceae bacterium]